MLAESSSAQSTACDDGGPCGCRATAAGGRLVFTTAGALFTAGVGAAGGSAGFSTTTGAAAGRGTGCHAVARADRDGGLVAADSADAAGGAGGAGCAGSWAASDAAGAAADPLPFVPAVSAAISACRARTPKIM